MSVLRHVGRLRHLALMVLLGCSKSGEPGACLRDAENACVEYDATVAAAGKRMCAGMKWERACPTQGRVGTCTKNDGAEILYGGPPNNYTPESAKTACEWKGGTLRR